VPKPILARAQSAPASNNLLVNIKSSSISSQGTGQFLLCSPSVEFRYLYNSSWWKTIVLSAATDDAGSYGATKCQMSSLTKQNMNSHNDLISLGRINGIKDLAVVHSIRDHIGRKCSKSKPLHGSRYAKQ
jgi:hypothetical protein